MQRLAEDFCIDWRPTNLLRFVPLATFLSLSLFAYRLTILLWKFRVEEARNIGPRFAL